MILEIQVFHGFDLELKANCQLLAANRYLLTTSREPIAAYRRVAGLQAPDLSIQTRPPARRA